jgi:hypothetical protein
MQSKFEETNALLRAMLNLQRDGAGRSTWLTWWCLVFCCIARTANFVIVGTTCALCGWKLVFFSWYVATVCDETWNLVFVCWNWELGSCVMFKPMCNILCFRLSMDVSAIVLYVDDEFFVMSHWKYVLGMDILVWQ